MRILFDKNVPYQLRQYLVGHEVRTAAEQQLSVHLRDTEEVYIAKAFAHQAQFFAAIAQVKLPPQVSSVTPTLGTDWNGESAVFFEVILADDSVPRPQLLALTRQISQVIIKEIRPLEEWGVLPYFNFLTQSEHARMKEPTWA